MKGSTNDMSSLTSLLNWRGDTRLAHLSGIVPITNDTLFDEDVERRIFDLSRLAVNEKTNFVRARPMIIHVNRLRAAIGPKNELCQVRRLERIRTSYD